MSLISKVFFAQSITRNHLSHVAFTVLLCVTPALSQKSQSDAATLPATLPKYDSQTETKTKGVVEDLKVFALGKRTDYTELMVKSGNDTVQIYLSPKPFEDEMGISFAKGDEVSVTGSKVKQVDSDVILAREIVKGTDTFMFRDDKGKPVWDERTGK
jgi:uncharacterized protein YdeI (BOF family)